MSDSTRETLLNAAFVQLAGTLTDDFDVVDLLHTLVERCAAILDTEAGGLMLADRAGDLQLVASTSEQASLVEIMQLNAGAGPCVDCFNTGKAVTVGDIERSGHPWPAFREEALAQGFRSVHATPMRLRGAAIGTMNLFSTRVGELNARDIAVAQALADVATIGILQEGSPRDPDDLTERLQHALDLRILIEQAKGVVAQTAGLEMEDAFGALRRYARSRTLTMEALARGVISREIRIDRDTTLDSR